MYMHTNDTIMMVLTNVVTDQVMLKDPWITKVHVHV